MSLIVQKFGGSSVRDAQRIRNVAGIIAETYLEGNDVLVVLSAQGDTTDDLIAKAEEINSHPSKREMDMLLATGEQISVALCAMALESMGLPCVSLTAWQVGIQTTAVHGDARIKRIDSERVQAELDQKSNRPESCRHISGLPHRWRYTPGTDTQYPPPKKMDCYRR